MASSIRLATISDMKALQDLNYSLFMFELKWHPTLNTNWPYDSTGIKYFVDRIGKVGGVIFVAENISELGDHEVVGYASVGGVFRYPFRTEEAFAQLENIIVADSHRKNGIGGQLMLAVRNWCNANGVKCLKVDTVFENTEAIKFYKREGFLEHNLQLETKIQ